MNIATNCAYLSAPSICAFASLLTMRVVPSTSSSSGSVTPLRQVQPVAVGVLLEEGLPRATSRKAGSATTAASSGRERTMTRVALPEGTWMMPLVLLGPLRNVRSLAPNPAFAHAAAVEEVGPRVVPDALGAVVEQLGGVHEPGARYRGRESAEVGDAAPRALQRGFAETGPRDVGRVALLGSSRRRDRIGASGSRSEEGDIRRARAAPARVRE